jgi:hypothetical protein
MDPHDLFAQRVAARLDEGLDQLAPHLVSRLDQARKAALLHAKPQNTSTWAGPNVLAWSGFGRRASTGLAALALLGAAMWGQYARIQWAADEAADIDEEILSQPAPVQAYTDPAFLAAWRSGRLKSTKPSEPD